VWAPAGAVLSAVSVAGRQHLHSVGLAARDPRHRGLAGDSTGQLPYATYIQNSLALTADWQQLTATGYIATNELAYLMIAISTPGTLWADDFALSFAPGTFVPTPRIGPIPTSFFGMHVENFLESQLLNSGFEPPYVSAGVNNPISGNTAVNWYDNSSWGVPNPP